MTTKIIVIDDDPTGSQTVHGCLLLTRWDKQTLLNGLRDESPLCFILSNTRGMDAERAATVTREICIGLREALAELAADGVAIEPLIVSRSDSTLRGHYPVETDVISETLGPFDAHFLVPAFFEGGRITRDGVHYLVTEGQAIRVDQTEFANDSVFGFSTSNMPDYVEEKTSGRISANAVHHFDLEDVRGDLHGRLSALEHNACCVVDAEKPEDLDNFARQAITAAASGKRFLFRSAASLLTSLAGLSPQPVAAADMGSFVRHARPGVVLVGSHVNKSSRQLKALMDTTAVVPLHVDLDRMVDDQEGLFIALVEEMDAAHADNRSVVIYTSRGERRFETTAQRLAFGEQVSAFLMRLVQSMPRETGFLISKGGITSNDTLSIGLALSEARVVGQIRAGCSVVVCPDTHARYPNLPVVIFPGNVGGDDALASVYSVLASPSEEKDRLSMTACAS